MRTKKIVRIAIKDTDYLDFYNIVPFSDRIKLTTARIYLEISEFETKIQMLNLCAKIFYDYLIRAINFNSAKLV